MLPKLSVMLEAFRKQNQNINPQKLTFLGVDGYDVYNPSTPFVYDHRTLIAARVEKRDSERSHVRFFECQNETLFVACDALPQFELQDPFITRIQDFFVFGGTFVDWDQNTWFTRLYYGPNLHQLTHWVDAPKGMKDVRVVECKDGKIGVFTRPQGGKAYAGTIGFTLAKSFQEVTTQLIADAPLLSLVETSSWSGVNDVMMLDDGTLGVIGHVATLEPDQMRHYYAMNFTLDPTTGKTTPMKVMAERSNFLTGPAKREDLVDVIFTAGLYFNKEKYYLYVGTSDCEVQRIECPYPF